MRYAACGISSEVPPPSDRPVVCLRTPLDCAEETPAALLWGKLANIDRPIAAVVPLMHRWAVWNNDSRDLGSRSQEFMGFVPERMLKGCGVDVDGGGFNAELFARIAPAGDGVEDFAENDFGLGRFKAEAGRGVDGGGDGRLFLILGDGGLRRMPAVDFRDGIQIISGRERPAPRRSLLSPKEFIALDTRPHKAVNLVRSSHLDRFTRSIQRESDT